MDQIISKEINNLLLRRLDRRILILFNYLQQTIEAWKIVFLVTIILYVIEILVYTIFGSGNEQLWNQIEAPDEEANDQTLPLRRNNRK